MSDPVVTGDQDSGEAVGDYDTIYGMGEILGCKASRSREETASQAAGGRPSSGMRCPEHYRMDSEH